MSLFGLNTKFNSLGIVSTYIIGLLIPTYLLYNAQNCIKKSNIFDQNLFLYQYLVKIQSSICLGMGFNLNLPALT